MRVCGVDGTKGGLDVTLAGLKFDEAPVGGASSRGLMRVGLEG